MENQISLTPELLTSVEFLTKSLVGATNEITQNVANAISAINPDDRTVEQKLFLIEHKLEVARLIRNEKSNKAKHLAAAKKAGLTLEQYEAQIGTRTGGRKAEYQFTQEDYDKYKAELLRKDLTAEEKLHWYEVKEEAEKVKKTQASKKSAEKKKLKEAQAEIVSKIEDSIEDIADVDIADAELSLID
jgi:hypothetical protein